MMARLKNFLSITGASPLEGGVAIALTAIDGLTGVATNAARAVLFGASGNSPAWETATRASRMIPHHEANRI